MLRAMVQPQTAASVPKPGRRPRKGQWRFGRNDARPAATPLAYIGAPSRRGELGVAVQLGHGVGVYAQPIAWLRPRASRHPDPHTHVVDAAEYLLDVDQIPDLLDHH